MKKILKRIGLILLILLFIALIPWLHFQIRNRFFPGSDLDISELRDEHLLLPDLIPVDDANNAYFDIEKSNQNVKKQEEITQIYDNLINEKLVDNKKINEILTINHEALKHLNNAFKKDQYFYPYNVANSQIFSSINGFKDGFKSPTEEGHNQSQSQSFKQTRLVYIKMHQLIQEKKYDEALALSTKINELMHTKFYSQNPSLAEALEFIVTKKDIVNQHKIITKNIKNFSPNDIQNFINIQKKLLKSNDIFVSGIKHEYLFNKQFILFLRNNSLSKTLKFSYTFKPIKSIKESIEISTMYQKQIKSCKEMHTIERTIQNKINQKDNLQINIETLEVENNSFPLLIKSLFIENTIGKSLVTMHQRSLPTFSYFEKKCENDKLFKGSLIELINSTKNQ